MCIAKYISERKQMVDSEINKEEGEVLEVSSFGIVPWHVTSREKQDKGICDLNFWFSWNLADLVAWSNSSFSTFVPQMFPVLKKNGKHLGCMCVEEGSRRWQFQRTFLFCLLVDLQSMLIIKRWYAGLIYFWSRALWNAHLDNETHLFGHQTYYSKK